MEAIKFLPPRSIQTTKGNGQTMKIRGGGKIVFKPK